MTPEQKALTASAPSLGWDHPGFVRLDNLNRFFPVVRSWIQILMEASGVPRGSVLQGGLLTNLLSTNESDGSRIRTMVGRGLPQFETVYRTVRPRLVLALQRLLYDLLADSSILGRPVGREMGFTVENRQGKQWSPAARWMEGPHGPVLLARPAQHPSRAGFLSGSDHDEYLARIGAMALSGPGQG